MKVASPTKLGIPVGRKKYTYQTLSGYPVTIDSKEHKDNKESLKGVLDRRPFDVAHPYADKGARVTSFVFVVLSWLRK